MKLLANSYTVLLNKKCFLEKDPFSLETEQSFLHFLVARLLIVHDG